MVEKLPILERSTSMALAPVLWRTNTVVPSQVEVKPPSLLEEKRTARFVSVAACAFPDGTSFTVRGECEGKIGYEQRGDNGFGFDPVFMVGDRSFAELTAAEKDAISHRGNSLRQLAEKLQEIINN